MIYDRNILYARKTINSRNRLDLYRMVAQGIGYVTVIANDGRTHSNPASIDYAQFDAEFEPTTERVESW